MALIPWTFHHPRMTLEALGFIPAWLNDADDRSAVDQLDASYGYGGFKQHPMTGFKHLGSYKLKYPGDPVMLPLASAKLRQEVICFYNCEILAVFQPDGSFVAARFD